MGLDMRKPVFGHLRSLISTFVIHILESTISKLARSEFSFFQLISVAEQAGLNFTLSETPNLTLSETPKTGFDMTRPKWAGQTEIAKLTGHTHCTIPKNLPILYPPSSFLSSATFLATNKRCPSSYK